MEWGEFHWTDGWMFKRLEGGAVRIRKYASDTKESGVIAEAIIPQAEWCSVIAHVSQDPTRIDLANHFHGVAP